jgi:hypothetical protein
MKKQKVRSCETLVTTYKRQSLEDQNRKMYEKLMIITTIISVSALHTLLFADQLISTCKCHVKNYFFFRYIIRPIIIIVSVVVTDFSLIISVILKTE